MNSNGKLAIVTGAGSGIGKAVALALLKEGHSARSPAAAPTPGNRRSRQAGAAEQGRPRCRPTPPN